MELKDFEQDVIIRSLYSPNWSFPHANAIDETIHPTDILSEEAVRLTQYWLDDIANYDGPLVSIFDISYENSEFVFHLTMSATGHWKNDNGTTSLERSVHFGCRITSVVNHKYFLDDFNTPQESTHVSVPITYDDVQSVYCFVKTFCEKIVMPVHEYKKEFMQDIEHEWMTQVSI